jgi:hypothetical protein
LVVNDAANADWVATGSCSPASRSPASVMIPDLIRTANRAAISLPSAEDGASTAAGDTASNAACSASTFGTTPVVGELRRVGGQDLDRTVLDLLR